MLRLLLQLITKNCDSNCFTKRLRKRISVFNITTRFLLEACVEMGLVALIAVIKMDEHRFDSFQDGLAIVLAIIALTCLIAAPLSIVYLARQFIYRPFLMTESQKLDIEQIFSAYRKDSMTPMCHLLLIFIRRLVMLNILCFLPNFLYAQIVAQLFTTLVLMFFTAYVKPYSSGMMNI